MDSKIVTPCISVCSTDPISGHCYGCGRTSEDKKYWKDPDTSDNWKINNLKELESRLSGWQLEAFKKSYAHKREHGISLLQKKMIESKNQKNANS